MGRLFWKIFFAFLLGLTAAAAGTAGAIWWHRYERESVERELVVGPPDRLDIDMAAFMLSRAGGAEPLREWMADFNSRRRLPLFVVDGEGKDLLGRPVPPAALTRAKALAAQPAQDRRSGARLVKASSGESYLLFVPLPSPLRRAPPPPVQPWQLILIGVASSLVASALLAWYLSRPIRNLRWAFGAAAEGRLETRVLPLMGRRRDEIADLGRDFDRMAQQLQSLVSSQQRLLHDVSHELRSPLARLQAAAGLLRQDPARLDASLERIERETARLDALVGELLELARLETGNGKSSGGAFDFADLVAGAVEDARFEAEAAGRKVSFQGNGEMMMSGRGDLLHRAVENVLRNAVKYTAPGTSVEVVLLALANPPAARLIVTDRGPGVPGQDLDRIFEPFYRSPSAADAQGFGLGLAIAQRAIAVHSGSIRAANDAAGGLRMEIQLPRV